MRLLPRIQTDFPDGRNTPVDQTRICQAAWQMPTVNLTEGDYVLMCWIPDKNGVPHVALGMQKALFVRGGKATKVSTPKPSISVKQIDYQFTLSQRITAGLHTIEVHESWYTSP